VGTPKKPKKKTVQPIAAHSAYWRGQKWTIARIDDETQADKMIGKRTLAEIFPDKALVVYRGCLTDEAAIMAILHEAGHEMFPEWESESQKESTAEVGVFERDVKSFLEAFGVDLSPLLPRKGK
jgi:hypothetical protein